jgi:hypothetical protein
MIIKENMPWPPTSLLEYKMREHSAWYSGSSELLANFYTEYVTQNYMQLPYTMTNNEMFWSRQIKNKGEIFVHVPVAGDIAETSANFLFSEAPLIKITEANTLNGGSSYKKAQEELDTLLVETGFHRKLLEGAESASAICGVYLKIAWDEELSEYPIPVVVQADKAIPEFVFGILTAVTFWKVVDIDETGNKVLRLLERYERGYIRYSLWLGTGDKLGSEIDLNSHPETADLEQVVETGIDDILAVYVPNMLPNRLDRNSYLGRSDYLGIEGLMDSLDETFTNWMREIVLAQPKIMIPESFLTNEDGKQRYNIDQMLYVKLDMDPTIEGQKITTAQFEIRADQFEKTVLNLLERIVTSAGYSPQSFGLNIQGRAESGTALSMRERKSFATRNKKQSYWQPAIKKLVQNMILVYNIKLGGNIEPNVTINVAFSDGITNDMNEISSSVKMISDAIAASTETKVRLLHPDWSEKQIADETTRIKDENGLMAMENPDSTNPMDNNI